MKISLKIIETESQIEKMVMNALLPSCDEFLRKALIMIKSELPAIVSSAILNRPEYISLVSGNLRLEFGIPNANAKIATIINNWIDNISYMLYKPKLTGSRIKASISVEAIKSDFSDVLQMSEAKVNDALRGYELPWLEWLLLDGSKIIVPKHDVVFGPNPRSRTGGAVMKISSGGWKVPSEYAGTFSDNWITRAIDDSSPLIEKLLEKALS